VDEFEKTFVLNMFKTYLGVLAVRAIQDENVIKDSYVDIIDNILVVFKKGISGKPLCCESY
jgi:ATP adenylyltransferase/5',5'''-P-1,P-4-tetraphosphate phosphorylase II